MVRADYTFIIRAIVPIYSAYGCMELLWFCYQISSDKTCLNEGFAQTIRNEKNNREQIHGTERGRPSRRRRGPSYAIQDF